MVSNVRENSFPSGRYGVETTVTRGGSSDARSTASDKSTKVMMIIKERVQVCVGSENEPSAIREAGREDF